MARAGFSSSEAEVLHSIKADLKQRLPCLLGKDDYHKNINYNQNNISWSVKADVSQWIRAAVSEHYENGSAYHSKIYENSVEVSSLTQEEFLVIRSILEQYGDLSMLADILIDASNSDDVRLLTCAVDTLNRHYECFTIIGALGDMFRSFYEAFLRVKTNGQPLYDLAYSMAEVGHRLPNEVNSLVLLRQELSRADRNLALAACSPVSDHMAETLNDASPSFNEDMDHFLSSGNSMDEMTMILVFQKLIQQLAFYIEKNQSVPSSVCRHLVQLRSFNSKNFDLLLVQWLETSLKSTSRPNLSRLLHPLVGIGCVTLPAFATLMKKLLQSGSLQPANSALPDSLVDFLELLVPKYSAEPLYDFLSYRFRIAQEEFLHGHSHEALALLKDAIPHMTLETQDLVSSVPSVVPLLSEIIVRHAEDTTLDSIRALMKAYPILLPVVRESLDLLLSDHQSNPDFLMETAMTIQKTNHLSLPLCQMKLQILFDEKNDDSIRNSIVDLMYKSAVADVRAGNTYWLDLVSTMGQEAAEQVCNH
jgi:mediator of RNA polymerase II transcription subunit 12